MKCKKCGSDVPSDSRFCSVCGDNLQNQNVSDSETTQEKDTLNTVFILFFKSSFSLMR